MSGLKLEDLMPRVEAGWYVLATSGQVKRKPLQSKLFGMPWVLFRNADGTVSCLQDRCPHRGIPLSEGEVVKGELQCPYHGWTFDGRGHCTSIPGRIGGGCDTPGRRVVTLPVVEQQGLVWVWGSTEVPPDREAPFFPEADDPAYLTVQRTFEVPAPLQAAIENALDVPHTAYLHGGLFRKPGEGSEVTCEVWRNADRVECRFLGEAAPTGLAARILGARDGELEHTDRFLMPCMTEVEYKLGKAHVLLRGAWTPVDVDLTRVHAVVSIRSPLPGALLKPALLPVARRIFAQDAWVLDLQRRQARTFGQAAYHSTALDVLGPHILRMLKQAEKGESSEPEALRKVSEVMMQV